MKTIEEIYEEMLSTFRTGTGAEAATVSDLSVRLYAVAAQVYGLYAQADWLSRQCFPQTAQGEWLDRHAALRALTRREAVKAHGLIRFSVPAPAAADLTVPAGTVCATAGMVRFETTQQAVLKAGQSSVTVPAQALEPGSAGNVGAGSILVMAAPPVGIGSCVNPEPFSGGADAETDEALRQRVLDTYRRMPNGANAAFYEQTALSFDQVAACTVLPRSRGRGTVDVVVSTAGGEPGAELLAQLQEHFEQRREIAVDVVVKAPTVKTVDVSVSVTAAEGADAGQVKADVEKTLRDFFSGALLSRDVLLAQLGQLVFSQKGVANCKLTAPTADVAVADGELPVLGTLTVEVTA